MFKGYAILRTAREKPPTDYRVLDYLPDDLDGFSSQPIAFDFETNGTNPITGSIRSIAISNDYGTLAIDISKLSTQDRIKLTNWLLKQKLIAHNAVFDAGWIYAKTGKMPKIEACTLVLFKLLATEGYLGQKWGLKHAMTSVLNWPTSNELDLHNWLKSNKLHARDMAQAPWEILGKYNALDAAGTWQLYKHFVHTIQKNGWEQNILQYHKIDFMNLIYLLIEQQMSGMSIDLEYLNIFNEKLDKEIEDKLNDFLYHPEVRPHVEYYQSIVIEDMEKSEPQKFTKSGEITSRFIKWKDKLKLAKSKLDFNVDSPQQLQWLFYERMLYTCPIMTTTHKMSTGKKAFKYLGEPGKKLKEYRELRDKRKFSAALTNVHINGILHPNVKAHGTITGRSSGGVD